MSIVGDSDPECTDEIGVLLPSGGRLVETDGSTASSSGHDVVVLDWALDAATTRMVVVGRGAELLGADPAASRSACCSPRASRSWWSRTRPAWSSRGPSR